MNSSLSCPFCWWYWRVNVAGSKQPTALFIFMYSHFNMLLLVICESIWTSQAVCMSLTISGILLIVIVKLAGGVQLCCLYFLFMYLFIFYDQDHLFFWAINFFWFSIKTSTTITNHLSHDWEWHFFYHQIQIVIVEHWGSKLRGQSVACSGFALLLVWYFFCTTLSVNSE